MFIHVTVLKGTASQVAHYYNMCKFKIYAISENKRVGNSILWFRDEARRRGRNSGCGYLFCKVLLFRNTEKQNIIYKAKPTVP